MRTGSRSCRTWPHKFLGSNTDHWSKDSVLATKKYIIYFFISLTNLNCAVSKGNIVAKKTDYYWKLKTDNYSFKSKKLKT